MKYLKHLYKFIKIKIVNNMGLLAHESKALY